ncbi:MAG: hypothetical protein FJ303_24985 [Planctomycetes bacterium]|nr:hypothetical protein [Planctomycetota bacterium]
MKALGIVFTIALSSTLLAGDDPAERLPVRVSGNQKAPEFVDIEAWINSEPLTMRQLKGKIVVVHFMAFG